MLSVLLVVLAWMTPLCVHANEAPAPILYVPLDDRPVTLQLPLMLGEIAGRRVSSPPSGEIGRYLTPGDPDALLAWLRASAARGASGAVVSTDMTAYGGLVASRTPDVREYRAITRLRKLAALHKAYPSMPLDAFATIMRLAPTGLPVLPITAEYWATGDTVAALQLYANLPDPPRDAAEEAQAEALHARIGHAAFTAYMASRARNRDVDLFLLNLAAQGTFEHLILGQDDAGPVGLHVRDVATLAARARRLNVTPIAAIEPGADELGMILLAARFARDIAWSPKIRVRYSRADALSINDPLEFAPIDVTISRLIDAVGAHRVEDQPDIDLFVEVAGTGMRDEQAFVDAVNDDVGRRLSVAVADLTFLGNPNPSKEQQRLTEELIARGIAGSVDAFASWNTTANTVGTALAEAVAVGAGKRSGGYDARAHARFTLDRYIDDYAFHQFVRPVLNANLRAHGIDPTLLTPEVAVHVSHDVRVLLWPYALRLLEEIFPHYRDAGMTITLPWQRTFETWIDVRLTAR